MACMAYKNCSFVISLLFGALLGYHVAFANNHSKTCNYSAGVLRITNSNTLEAEECIKQHKDTIQLHYTNSDLAVIPDSINNLKHLEILDLSENNILDANFSNLDFKICSGLKSVCLDLNKIAVLKRGHLDCLQNINTFYISNNSLTTIENGTFSERMEELRYIHIGYNELTELDTSLFARVKLHKPVHITINASWNNINTVTNSYNLTINDFSRKITLGLVLLHNNFTTINVKHLSEIFNLMNPLQLLNFWNCGFDLRFNPLICDCSLYNLAKLLRTFHYMDPDNPLFSLTCGHPKSLNGKLVRKVDLNDFNCSVSKECPTGCQCTLTINLDLITVRCNDNYNDIELPQKCPKATNLSIDMNTDKLERLSRREYMKNVTLLDVSGCGISVIDPDFIRQLEKIPGIYLHDNKLAFLPQSFKKIQFGDEQLMTLYGNPFVCDCHTLWIKRWLIQNKKHVAHEDKTFCASGPGRGVAIVNVPDSDFVCLHPLSTYTIIGIAVGSVVFLIIVSVIVNRYKTHVQVWLISNFDICKYCCRQRATNEFQYDVFVPHSCEDDDDVYKVVALLESQSPPYKVCLGERDFSVGKTITENILHAVKSSHTTLLFVSNNFLRSSWCDMEFREAHTRFLRDRDINLIVVVLEELKQVLMNQELKSYMDSHVYINYKDKRFFARLLVNLPVIINEKSSETTPLIS